MGSIESSSCIRLLTGLLAVLLLCALSLSVGADQLQSAQIGGRTRQWLVHIPSMYRPGHGMPLVIAFHGHYGTPAGMARLAGLDGVADRDGFIVVYPAGIDRAWAAEVNTADDKAGVDDVAFTAILLAHLERQYSIDPHHIVLTGFSNGAHMVELLGCRLADRITAIVPVSGTLASQAVAGCHPARPLTVIEFHGTDDPIDPFDGGKIRIRNGGAVVPVLENIENWAKWNHCRPASLENPRPASDSSVHLVRLEFPDCENNVRVMLYEIVGGGHTWPGGPQYLPKFLIGQATHLVDASEVIGQITTKKALSEH